MVKNPRTVGLGGTFDHFHLGHQKLISQASEVGEKLLIGVTTDAFARQLEKQFSESLESYESRSASVSRFCETWGFEFEVFPLDDPYGPTLTADTKVQLICVSTDTKKTADKLNHLRAAAGLTELPVEIVSLVRLESGEILSSTLIRQGRANRAGELYESVLTKPLTLSETQRAFFAKPQGEFVEEPVTENGLRIVVGDSSLQRFIANNWKYDLGVFDYQIGRKPYDSPVIAAENIDIIAANPAGAISTHLVRVLKTALEKKMCNVFVEGEEDLAAVALVLLAPLEAEIFYGQPGDGLVCISCTEEKKNTIYKILLQ
ncbi:MAG: pantetheine-phosphate adenylyltransferase [bacterium]|nr:pantetheine-phosphate adenylyltransferase [bacterium]